MFFYLVSTSLPQSQRRSYNSLDWDNSTTVFSSSLTKLPGTWSEWSSLSSLTDSHPEPLSPTLSTREDTVKSTDAESHSLTTPSLPLSSVRLVLPALRTSFTRSSPVDQNSRKPTTSSGHSSSHPHSVDLRSRDTLSPKDTVPSVTEKSSLMHSSRKWCECERHNEHAESLIQLLFARLISFTDQNKERLNGDIPTDIQTS